MTKIVYYVAVSMDGFIADRNGGIDGFIHDDGFVDHYQKELQNFGTVIMGRKTYEFGYRFGLEPGRKAYPHMDHYVFSKSIELPRQSDVRVVDGNWQEKLATLRQNSGTDIYLCGGGQFAGWLLSHHLIDILRLKINPFYMGDGIRLFGNHQKSVQLKPSGSRRFDCGITENAYEILYS